MKMRAAWWWIDRWRKSTAYTDMSLAEQGAYRNLLDELWLRGGVLPADERLLAKISGDALQWRRVRDKVMARFERTPEGYRNETHDEVQAWSERQRGKGKRGADARWHGQSDGQTDGQTDSRKHGRSDGPKHGLRHPSPSPLTNNGSMQVGERPIGNGPPADLPPADRTETAIRKNIEGMRSKLYGLIDAMKNLDPEGRDPTELMRLVTGYQKADGTTVKGVVNAAMLTFERLEKSIEDAEANISDWKAARK